MRKRITASLMGVAMLIATAGPLMGECAPFISCSLEDGPCGGELVGGFTIDLSKVFAAAGVITIYSGLGVCFDYCEYAMTDADGNAYQMEFSDWGCDGEGTATFTSPEN